MGWTRRNGIAKTLAILFASVLAPMAQAQELTLPQNGGAPVILHVTQGEPRDEMLTVFVKGAETPIAGRYTFEGNALSFTPAFGFEPGQDYVAKIGGDGKQVTFRLPHEPAAVQAAVTEIYPSGDTLPENTLRFYIHFSAPMQPQVAFDYIKLRDASGTVDTAAFMRFKQELWSEDRTRLTVLIDPGRIKREVATNVELGPALLSGGRYTLTVEGGWPSADGATALPAFAKGFDVSDALRERPDVRFWSTNTPCTGTAEPLVVALDRPFDRHQLTQSLRVENDAGDEIDGVIDVQSAEQIWRFIPTEPWPAGDLRLIVDTTLEDVAGNNFHDLLDHLASEEEGTAAQSEILIRPRSCSG